MKRFYRTQLIATLVFLIVFLSFFSILYNYSSKTISDNQYKQLILERSHMEIEIENYFLDIGHIVETIAAYIKINGDAELLDYLVEVDSNSQVIFSIYYLTVENKMTNSTGFIPPPSIDLRNRVWYTSAIETDDVSFSPVFLNASEDKMIVTVSKAIYNGDELLGVIASDIDILTIQNYVYNKKVGRTGYAFLIDVNDNIIAHPSIDFDGLELISIDFISLQLSKFQGTGFQDNFKMNGSTGVLAYSEFIHNSYEIFLYIPNQEYEQSGMLLLSKYIMLTIMSLTIGAAFIFFNQKYIFKPFDYLVEDIDKIDLGKDMSYHVSVDSKKGFTMIRKVLNEVIKTTTHYFELNQIANRELSYENQRVMLLIDSAADIIFEIDRDRKFVSVYGKGVKKTKISPEFYIGKNAIEVFGDEGIERDLAYQSALNGIVSVYDWKIKVDDEMLYFESSISPMYDENEQIVGAVGISRDITEATKRQSEIDFINRHDYLTGLYNRRYYAEMSLEYDQEDYYPLAIVNLDLNGLKIINDAYGHIFGDDALVQVGKVLLNSFDEKDIIARIGGDEFAVIVPNATFEEVEEIKNKIRHDVSLLSVENIHLSIAIGFELKYDKSQNIHDIIKYAENKMYRNKLTEGMSVRNNAIRAIHKTLTDKYSAERVHSERVSALCKALGMKLGIKDEELNELVLAGLYHDIGKISIPDAILDKPARLTDDEYDIMKTHTEAGYQILKAADEYSNLAEYALTHHERWDGKGYPRGLKKNEIPLYSRIINICDSFEAMTSDRVYRKKMEKKEAVEEIIRCSGKQYDPELAKLFVTEVLKAKWIDV